MTAPRAVAFTKFVLEVLKVQLTSAQRVLCLVAFDGAEPGALASDDRELARKIFGDVETIPAEARHVLVAVCGARSGKSYVLCALRLLYLALTVPLDTLAPGELAVAVIVAPDLRLGRQTLRYALGAAKGCKAIASRLESESADGFTLKREGGRTVSLECLPATRGGSALRGRSLVGAVLDESAFFRDESYQVNDQELFKAVAPRVMAGGQCVIASTPWAEAGLLFELYRENHGAPKTAIAAHAPTLLLRNDPRVAGIVAREQERDPANAAREFGAEFMAAGTGAFFDPAAIERAADASIVLPAPRREGAFSGVGADFGFRSDSSALVVTQRVGDIIYVDAIEERRPERGKPLLPSQVVADFAAIGKRYGSSELMSDGHYRMSIQEHLDARGLTLLSAPEGALGKAKTYVEARTLLAQGRVRLPQHERLLRQLREVVATPTSGGGVSIQSPRWRQGGHGDLVSALVLALWRASRDYDEPESPAPARPKLGTREWIAAEAERFEREDDDVFEKAQRLGSNWRLLYGDDYEEENEGLDEPSRAGDHARRWIQQDAERGRRAW